MDNLPLVLDLVRWVGERPRRYDEVMDAWRTSCPRLSVWEDTVDAGLVQVRFDENSTRVVSITPAGKRLLDNNKIAASAN